MPKEAKLLVVIPARLQSARLPGKPLQVLGGMTLLEAVVRRVQAMNLPDLLDVVVAVDNKSVGDAVRGAAKVYMTSKEHLNGTERVAEVARLPEFEEVQVVLNVQGDQPFITEIALYSALAQISGGKFDVGTATLPLLEGTEADPNCVKALLSDTQECFAFCRLIGYHSWPQVTVQEHVGVYAYKPVMLQRWAEAPATPLERALALEQVRALQLGMRVGTSCDYSVLGGERSFAVDTEEDLKRAQERVEVEDGD